MGEKGLSKEVDQDFLARREASQERINRLDHGKIQSQLERREFFETVYETAKRDAALVPWADLHAKNKLSDWLANNPGNGSKAIDVACGLGDNAEAMASAGYETTAFDFSPRAIGWAQERFPDSPVKYQVADLFDLPNNWSNAFDLVHECFTLQSIPPETLAKSIPAVANLVSPGGTLLVYTRTRPDGESVEGPPWPLEEKHITEFEQHGMSLVIRDDFIVEKPGRTIPHVFCEWRKIG